VSDYYLGRFLMLLTGVAIIALVAGGARLCSLLWVRQVQRRGLEIQPSTRGADHSLPHPGIAVTDNCYFPFNAAC
jgi:hypothetical protein